MNIIQDDLATKPAKSQFDAVQLAQTNQMGSMLGIEVRHRKTDSRKDLEVRNGNRKRKKSKCDRQSGGARCFPGNSVIMGDLGN